MTWLLDTNICVYLLNGADLKRQGKRIEDFDILVASIAIANDLTLVTHNTMHFSRIDGLRIEDWLVTG